MTALIPEPAPPAATSAPDASAPDASDASAVAAVSSTSAAGATAAPEPALRVSALELFFDLVFVFTITQLTGSLAHHLTVGGMVQVLVMLAVIWWMYDAFIWLTNAMPPSTHGRRGMLLLGMAAFLVVSLAVPHAFEGSGLAFGWAYLVIVAVHTGMFAAAGVAVASVLRMGGLNLVNTGLVVTGGYLSGSAQLGFWVAAFALQFAIPRLVDLPQFQLRADHFVERHGLIVIIAFGESVIAIGVGAGDADLSAPLIATALLTLAVCVGLWWAYFGHDDDTRAEHHMAGLGDARRNQLAVSVYNLGHYGLLLGVLLFAAGVKSAVGHPGNPVTLSQAAALAAGVALFLAANAAVRRTFGLTPLLPRLVAAAALTVTVPLGTGVSALAQVAATAGVLAAAFGYEEWTVRAR
ncbi:low temperature requirement protein A [Kitasatospora sp. NBC_00240]|uniref:low temperature requirement protein A n=1 Tax=Kitasatospora sp. NBC_00240 TaxID=2903567 RepID=UPI00224EF70E|nr:low temperature requirement protein A [Kitasatospora sp. NBC_00240]MCX5211487.1 low temperature requirement protein A [Kitasatospora sp. NBC_00240]